MIRKPTVIVYSTEGVRSTCFILLADEYYKGRGWFKVRRTFDQDMMIKFTLATCAALAQTHTVPGTVVKVNGYVTRLASVGSHLVASAAQGNTLIHHFVGSQDTLTDTLRYHPTGTFLFTSKTEAYSYTKEAESQRFRLQCDDPVVGMVFRINYEGEVTRSQTLPIVHDKIVGMSLGQDNTVYLGTSDELDTSHAHVISKLDGDNEVRVLDVGQTFKAFAVCPNRNIYGLLGDGEIFGAEWNGTGYAGMTILNSDKVRRKVILCDSHNRFYILTNKAVQVYELAAGALKEVQGFSTQHGTRAMAISSDGTVAVAGKCLGQEGGWEKTCIESFPQQ